MRECAACGGLVVGFVFVVICLGGARLASVCQGNEYCYIMTLFPNIRREQAAKIKNDLRYGDWELKSWGFQDRAFAVTWEIDQYRHWTVVVDLPF